MIPGSMRKDGRAPDALRPVKVTRHFTQSAPGSVVIEMGKTIVLCTAVVERGVPDFLKGKGQGWVTAEYGMLPGSTDRRKPRERAGKVDGRTQEIQRLIGRSLRAVVSFPDLGENTVWVDCDVLQADGGTRTAAITGGYIALVDALKWMESKRMLFKWPLPVGVAAISVGMVEGEARLDLDYVEDVAAEVDMNVVMTGDGRFIEVQGTAEKKPFGPGELERLLALGRKGIAELDAIQRKALA